MLQLLPLPSSPPPPRGCEDMTTVPQGPADALTLAQGWPLFTTYVFPDAAGQVLGAQEHILFSVIGQWILAFFKKLQPLLIHHISHLSRHTFKSLKNMHPYSMYTNIFYSIFFLFFPKRASHHPPKLLSLPQFKKHRKLQELGKTYTIKQGSMIGSRDLLPYLTGISQF